MSLQCGCYWLVSSQCGCYWFVSSWPDHIISRTYVSSPNLSSHHMALWDIHVAATDSHHQWQLLPVEFDSQWLARSTLIWWWSQDNRSRDLYYHIRNPNDYVIWFVSLFWVCKNQKLSDWLEKHTNNSSDISKPLLSIFGAITSHKKIQFTKDLFCSFPAKSGDGKWWHAL